MQIEQRSWTRASGWAGETSPSSIASPQLVLVFGATEALAQGEALKSLSAMYPGAHIFGCSTAGEIAGPQVSDDTIVATAVHLEHTHLRFARVTLTGTHDSERAGRELARTLIADDLTHVFVLSDGLHVNGSALVAGIEGELPDGVAVTGGLSADGWRFGRTLVCFEGTPVEGIVAAIGFYGSRLRVGYASVGGWDTFGPDRLITRSEGNVLYELDGKPALDLYRRYLGDHAGELPSSGLLFPLSLRTSYEDAGIVRTLLAIDDETGSMTFAGDIPQDSYARLMRTNFDRLIDGASLAASATYAAVGTHSPDLAILISCAGRKMVLKQRTAEEVESVRDILGERAVLAGFYSYGEISPFTPSARCELHNQTMTVTALSEN
jgi:hypothetical protein